MLSGRGLCDELITHPEESYRLWCVVVCDVETSRIGAPYIYDISSLRVKYTCSGFLCPDCGLISLSSRLFVWFLICALAQVLYWSLVVNM